MAVILPNTSKALVFDEIKHIYRLNGIIVPSVTQVMKPLSDETYRDVDAKVLRRAAGKGTAVHITLEEPMEADAEITICVLSVAGFIPSDAHYTVEVTNNANDDEPVWEDCTSEAKNGANHIFENKTAANGFALNFRVTAERGPSGEGGYITSVQGGFQ